MGATRRRVRSRRGRDGPVPTPCVQAQCFDPLVRLCVACKLLRTPDPRHASVPSDPRPSLPSAPRPPSPSPPPAAPSSQAPGTALQPQESVGAGSGPDAGLPLPGLLFGAQALLGLVLALALVALVSWRWRQQRRMASPETPDAGQDDPVENVFLPSSESLQASAPVWPLPKEDADTTLPGHSVPVPATELGSTELVTTKTAGPELQ